MVWILKEYLRHNSLGEIFKEIHRAQLWRGKGLKLYSSVLCYVFWSNWSFPPEHRWEWTQQCYYTKSLRNDWYLCLMLLGDGWSGDIETEYQVHWHGYSKRLVIFVCSQLWGQFMVVQRGAGTEVLLYLCQYVIMSTWVVLFCAKHLKVVLTGDLYCLMVVSGEMIHFGTVYGPAGVLQVL